MAALLRAATKLACPIAIRSNVLALQHGRLQAHMVTPVGTALLRAAVSYAPHLSGLRFQQTLARDAPMNPLPTLMDPSTPLKAFGDSTSENVKWVCKKSYYTEYIDDYDLKGHKGKIFEAANAANATYSERALIIAMAMVETTHMTASERDSTKDFWPPPPFLSANFSAFNLNRHFLLTLGKAIGEDVETPKGLKRLNEDKYVDEAVGYLVKAIRRWGVKADGSDYDIDGLKTLLDFHRGGSKARDDHVSYGAVEYRDSLQFIYNKVCFEDKDLQTDSRRVELNITYQSDQPTPLSTPSSSTS